MNTFKWGAKKLKKRLVISFSALAVIIGGIYFYLILNPPLEIGTLAWSNDKKSVIVGVGNKGFQNLEIVDVLVNNGEAPAETKVQVSNALLGFVITDKADGKEAAEYNFTNIEDVTIKKDTSPSANLKKLNDETATRDDVIYGVNVFDDKEIHNVYIKYRYLGMQYEEIVEID